MDFSLSGSSIHGILQSRIYSLLQAILPTQGSNPGLPHCRWIHLSTKLKYKETWSKQVDLLLRLYFFRASQVVQLIKNPPANTRDTRDTVSIPGSAGSPEVGNSNPLLYSCLENPMDRGAWRAIVHGDVKSQTRLSNWAWSTFLKIKETWYMNSMLIGINSTQQLWTLTLK